MNFKHIFVFILTILALASVSPQAQTQTQTLSPEYREDLAKLSGPNLPPMGLDTADERVRAASRQLHSDDIDERAAARQTLQDLTADDDLDVATDARISLAVMTSDKSESLSLLESCVAANPDAMHCLTWLGVYRRFGTGGDIDAVGSTRAFKRAAALGSPDAQWYYGMALFRGLGVAEDADAGFLWVEKSAKQDHLQGLVSYATMNALGQGTPIRKDIAFSANARAAHLGNVHAIYVIGRNLQTGSGVKKNLDLADAALLMAAKNGHPDAARRVRKLLAEIPKEDAEAWYAVATAREADVVKILAATNPFP